MESTSLPERHHAQIPQLQPQPVHYPPQAQQILSTLNPNILNSLPQPPTTSYYPSAASSYATYVSAANSSQPKYSPSDARILAAVQQYGVDPAAYVVNHVAVPTDCKVYSAAPNLYSNVVSYPFVNPQGNGSKKKQPKKPKIVQSAHCEICNIDCNSKDVLDQHKLGKKHKKNLEKLKELNASASLPATELKLPPMGLQPYPNQQNAANELTVPKNVSPVGNLVTTEPDSIVTARKSQKKAACETPEGLESKRRKVVDGGAAVEAIRTCTLCNVVCNSDIVFKYHLAGQKHAATMKKYAAASLGTAVN